MDDTAATVEAMLAGRQGLVLGGSLGSGSVEGSLLRGEGIAVNGEGSTVIVEASPPDREPLDASREGLGPHDEPFATRSEAVTSKRKA
ncbi:MAG TPA: hypothetical protein VIF09_13450, partial [Polyangiaceae bacterium]